MKIKNKYDLIIVGGGTAGVSCAYNAAILGLKVLIIEKNSFLGGSITSSLVIPAMKTSDNSINNDFFNFLYKKLCEINGAIKYCDGNIGWFNLELTKIILDEIMINSGVDILFESNIKDAIIKNNKILSVYIDTLNDDKNICNQDNILSSPIETKYIVDATGDANFCKKINCEFLNISEKQPYNLRFILSGVDSKKFAKWIMNFDDNRDVTTVFTSNSYTYFSTAYTWDNNVNWALKPIVEKAIADGVITNEDANYIQMFSIAGTKDSVAFNAPRLINENLSSSEAYIVGRSAILRITNFCKKYLSGFENAHISSIANSLGIRASRQVKCKYIYTIDDLLSGKTFDNPVVISNYPVDIHSTQKGKSVLKKVNKEYQLPLESLMVEGFDNLFVAGRCLSADFKSQAALRIIPSCFSMGEGVAKYIAKQININ